MDDGEERGTAGVGVDEAIKVQQKRFENIKTLFFCLLLEHYHILGVAALSVSLSLLAFLPLSPAHLLKCAV